MQFEKVVSRLQIAAALGVAPQTIAKWTRQGRFPEPAYRLGPRLIMYREDEVSRAIAKRIERAAAK